MPTFMFSYALNTNIIDLRRYGGKNATTGTTANAFKYTAKEPPARIPRRQLVSLLTLSIHQ